MKRRDRNLNRKLTRSEVIFIFILASFVSFITIGLLLDNLLASSNLSPFSLGGGTATRVTSGQGGMARVPTTPPGIPGNVAASLGAEQIIVSWDSPVGQVDGYNIYKDSQSQFTSPVFVGSVSGSDLDFVDIEMFMGETAFYAVTAFNSAGESGYSVVRQGRVNANYGMRWQYPGDVSWIAELVTFGNNDERVFTHYGSFVSRDVLFSSADFGIATPLMDYNNGQTDADIYPHISAAKNSDEFASIYLQINNYPYGQVVLEKFSSNSITSGGPDWQKIIPSSFFHTGTGPVYGVKVSDDGSQLLVWIANSQTTSMDYYIYDSLGNLQSQGSVSSVGSNAEVMISGDLTKAILIENPVSVKLVDLPTGTQKTILTFRIVYGRDITSDGSHIVFVKNTHPQTSDAELFIYSFQGGNFVELSRTSIPSNVNYYDIVLSDDGSRAVYSYAANEAASPHLVGVVGIDTVNPSQDLMRYEYSSLGSLGNTVTDISMDNLGTRFVAGYWGDESDETSEIKVFEMNQNNPLVEFFTLGSVLKLGISGDGTKITAGIAGDHTQISNHAGEINVYDLP